MVYTRDLRPDKHVYANPVTDFLQQVHKALKICLSKLWKRFKSKVRARWARSRHKPPSFVQLPPWQCRGNVPSPRLCDVCSHQATAAPRFYRAPQVNKSYESMPQINPLSKLYVTNPDPPTPPASEGGLSATSTILITKSGGNIPPAISFKAASGSNRPKRSLHVCRHGQPRKPLQGIPEEPIPASLSAGTEIPQHPPSTQHTYAGRVKHIGELWLTTTPTDLLGSPFVYSSATSTQDEDFAPSSCLPALPHVHPQSSEWYSPRVSVIAPIRSLRPSRSRRLSFPPRIPSLYFRAGSPFADGAFPWDRKE